MIRGLTYLKKAIPDTSEVLHKLKTEVPFYNIDKSNGRRICQYGYRYDYYTKKCVKIDPVPEYWLNLIKPVLDQQEIKAEFNWLGCQFNQVLINEYQPGQGIAPHIDSEIFGDTILCLTINSGAVLVFEKGNEVASIYPENGDVYIMQSDARYKYKHFQPARKKDPGYGPRGVRYSITYRTV
jgi:alkylated DNA repair dioxygenase AlkB